LKIIIYILLPIFVLLVFLSCGTPKVVRPFNLENERWQLIQIIDQKVEISRYSRNIYLVFRSRDGRMLGYSGCGEILGFYSSRAGSINITLESEPQQFCSETYVEMQLYEGLPKIDSYRINNDTLLLEKSGLPVFIFEGVHLPEFKPD
jgi:heat shock protein HslJ